MDEIEIREHTVSTNISLGLTYDDLDRYNKAIICYEEAKNKSNQYGDEQMIRYRLDACYNLALTCFNKKDYDRSLHIFLTDCTTSIRECILTFGSTEYRVKEWNIYRWITRLRLKKNYMKSANKSAKEMLRISIKHLSKRSKFKNEALTLKQLCYL